MTRLAFDLDDWEDQPFRGDAPLTQALIDSEDGHVPQRPAVGLPAARATPSTSSRRSAGTTTSRTSTPTATSIDDVQRQVMLSGRELALDQNPSATGWVNQRIVYTHGIGVAMVPVNEVANEGQPRLFIGNLPPVSVAGRPDDRRSRASTSASGRRDYVVVGAKQAEFDYPTGEGDGPAAAGTETRWTGTTGDQARQRR